MADNVKDLQYKAREAILNCTAVLESCYKKLDMDPTTKQRLIAQSRMSRDTYRAILNRLNSINH